MTVELEEVMAIAGHWHIWLFAIIIVSFVFLQAILYVRGAFRAARAIGYPKTKCIQAFRVGAVTAIGPCLAVVIVMIALMVIIGAPMAWLRLAVIGAPPTELAAATVGAEAYGVELGGPGYNLQALAASWWTMAINGIGWLLLVGLFTQKLEVLREKAGGGDPKWLSILSWSAMLGCFGFLISAHVIKGGGSLTAVVVGGACMALLLLFVAPRLRFLREYTLGIAMLLGLTVAAIFFL